MHSSGINWECFQVSLTKLLACKRSSGDTQANYPQATEGPGWTGLRARHGRVRSPWLAPTPLDTPCAAG